MHYEQPVLMNFVITMCAVLTLVCCVYALIAIRQKRLGDPSRKSTWYIFLAGTMVIMFILGIILGTVNYWRHLESFYDIQNLSVYPAVDPDKSSGLQYMDAGRVMFVKDSKVQTSMSSGFKVSDTIVLHLSFLIQRSSLRLISGLSESTVVQQLKQTSNVKQHWTSMHMGGSDCTTMRYKNISD